MGWFRKMIEEFFGNHSTREAELQRAKKAGAFGTNRLYREMNGLKLRRGKGVRDALGHKMSPGRLRMREIGGCNLQKAWGVS